MAQRTIDGFILDEAVVVCPECQTPFRTEVLTETRPLNISDIVEADLHRVFTDAALRAAFLSLCPECKYCAWASQFQPFNIRPELVKPQAEIEPARKYALAVKWAREKKIHNLDIAFIALNGLWCAREANEPDALWLELAIFEHEKGMETSTVRTEDDGVTHLIMGELYRQARNFPAAIEQYTLAGTDPSIIQEILDHQRSMCAKGLSHVTALPLRIVRMLFDIVENDGTVSSRNTEDFEDAVFVPAKTVTTTATTGSKSQAEFANGNMLLSAEALEKIAAVVAAAKAQQLGLVPNVNQPALKLVPSNAPAATPASAYAAALAAAAALEAAENPAAAQAQRAVQQGESAGTISQLKTTGPGVFERSSGKPGTQAAIASAAASQVAAKQAAQVQAAGVSSAASAAATGAVPPQRTSASAQASSAAAATSPLPAQAASVQSSQLAQNINQTESSAQVEDDGSTPLVAAIAALFSDNSSILAKTDLGAEDDHASPAPAAKTGGANLIPDANVPIPQAAQVAPVKTEPTIKPVAARAKQSAEPVADSSNVIEIASFDPTAKPETTRPNSAARAAAINARAKSVSAAQNLDPTAANASKRRATRKDRRKQERMPGAQNVRSDHRVTRLPIATAVVNAKGWVTDYGGSAQAQAQTQQKASKSTQASTPIQQAQRSQSSGGSGMELADYEIVGIEEPKAALPDMAIDDPTGYKGENVPDYTDAISRVENYLSFSRRLYQRNVRGYN